MLIRLLKRWFSKRPSYKSTTVGFPELDIDELISLHSIEKKAEEAGKNEKPATESVQYDATERLIIDLIEGEKKYALEILHANLSAYSDRLQNMVFQKNLADILVKADTAAVDMRNSVHIGIDYLEEVKNRVKYQSDEIKRFMSKNSLARSAELKESMLLRYGLLLILLLIEAIFNGIFLAKGHTLGMLGGFGEAVVIALINVGSGYVVGKTIVPYINHVYMPKKILAYLSLFLYLIIILAFNIAVAHYRDALTAMTGENVGMSALASFINDPLGVNDIKSWMLTILGTAFSYIACYDTYCMDDKYPGYGKLVKRQMKDKEEYIELKEDLSNKLKDIKESVLEDINGLAQNIEISRNELSRIINEKNQFQDRFRQHLSYLNECGNRLMAVYRETNKKVRTTPEPERFSQTWESNKNIDLTKEAARYFSDVEIREKDIDTAISNLGQSSKKVLKQWEVSFRKYEAIERL